MPTKLELPSYARATNRGVEGWPEDGLWMRLEVWDLDAGERVEGVVEANVAEGWLVRHVRGPDGRLQLERPEGGGLQITRERVEGRFEFRLKQGADA